MSRSTKNSKFSNLSFSSEKELERKFEELETDLQNDDWKARMKALEQIKLMAANGTFNQFPKAFACQLLRIKELLGTQLLDPRSTLIREGSAAIIQLAETLQGDFDCLAEHLLPFLFKMIRNTITVITDCGNASLKAILQSGCRLDRILPKIMEHSKGSVENHKILRTRCNENLLFVLTFSEPPSLDKFADAYEEILRTALTDAVEEIRKIGREMFHRFIIHWPSRKDRFIASLDQRDQKYLSCEINSSYSKNSDEGPKTVTKNRSTSISSKSQTTAFSLSSLPTSNGGTSKIPVPTKKVESTPVPTENSSALAKKRPSSANAEIKYKVPLPVISSNSSSELKSKITPVPSSSIKSAMNPPPKKSSTSSIPKALQAVDMTSLLRKIQQTSSSNKSEFLQQLTSLKMLLESSEQTDQVRNYFPQIKNLLISFLSDSFLGPIPSEVFNCLKTLLLKFSDLFEPFLENVIPAILKRSIKSNEASVIASSQNVLQVIEQTYSADCLLPIFLRILDQQVHNPEIQVKILQIFKNFASYKSNKAFHNLFYVKQILQKIAVLCLDSTFEGCPLCGQLIKSLKANFPEGYQSAFGLLSNAQQVELHKLEYANSTSISSSSSTSNPAEPIFNSSSNISLCLNASLLISSSLDIQSSENLLTTELILPPSSPEQSNLTEQDSLNSPPNLFELGNLDTPTSKYNSLESQTEPEMKKNICDLPSNPLPIQPIPLVPSSQDNKKSEFLAKAQYRPIDSALINETTNYFKANLNVDLKMTKQEEAFCRLFSNLLNNQNSFQNFLEDSLNLVCLMLKHYSLYFVPILDLLVKRVFEMKPLSRTEKQLSKEITDLLLKFPVPEKLISSCLQLLQSEQNVESCSNVIQFFTAFFNSHNQSPLERDKIMGFLPIFSKLIKHENAQIRKGIVFCLADLYQHLKKEEAASASFLSAFSSTEIRLIEIYHNKRQSGNSS